MPPASWIIDRFGERGPLRRGVPRFAPPRITVPRVSTPARGSGADPDDGRPRRLVVCGDDPLAQRLIEELTTRYGAEVIAILPNRRRNHGPEIVKLLGSRHVIEAERLDLETFRRARVPEADALALVNQDDVGNIHAALLAQELNPDLHLVIRMFNMSLGYGIVKLFHDCRVLSDAAMAAPAFVSAALGEVSPVHVRLARRTLYVARRDDVHPEDVVCGLAATLEDGRTDLLPVDQDSADLVLAVANGAPALMIIKPGDEHLDDVQTQGGHDLSVVVRGATGTRRPSWFRRWLRRYRRRPFRALRSLINRKLRFAAAALVALLVLGTGLWSLVNQKLTWLDAAYLTILAAIGGADPDLQAGPAEKAIQTLLSIASIAFIPVITAAVVEAAVNARLAIALGRLKEPVEDHVVVVGLGNVGTRVIRRLHDLGVPVVAIDRVDNARGAQTARAHDIPLIIGDASRIETLQAASVETCRALVVVSTDDVVNLEAALQARALQPDLRVILRLFDGDFADRVQGAFGITSSHSVSYLAAPAFAAALLERSVVGTIPVARRVVVLAEVPIGAGTSLDGATVGDANHAGNVRVIALTTDSGLQTLWCPPDSHLLLAGDVLIAATTRLGLGRLLGQVEHAHPILGDSDPLGGPGNDDPTR